MYLKVSFKGWQLWNRGQKKSWTKTSTNNAIQAVIANDLTLHQASLQYNVPKSTLHNRISGRVQPDVVSGAPRYLDDIEEEELVRWLEGCAQVGYAKCARPKTCACYWFRG